MNRISWWFVLCLCQYGVLVFRCSAGQAESSGAYLNYLVGIFDRSKLVTGLIQCEIITDNVEDEQVYLIFKKGKFLKRTQATAVDQPHATCQWFDGCHAVSGMREDKWRFVIKEPQYATTEMPIVFLGEVFHYWDEQHSFFPNLDPAGQRTLNEGTEFTYVDRKSKAKIVFLAGPGDNQLPVSVTSYYSNATVMATWRDDKWLKREGSVWFPSSCAFEKHWPSANGKDARSQTQAYTVTEARFNMPVSDAWFTPQFPSGSSVQDNISDSKALLVDESFDFLSDFKDPLKVPLGRPGQSP